MIIEIPEAAFPLLRQWTVKRRQPVTVFDLETTTYIPHVKWMGITEVGMLTISASGQFEVTSALVDPERRIPRAARELTGISNEQVRGQASWSAWAQRLHEYAKQHVMIGFSSSGFDCPTVVLQNARYGVTGTEFKFSLDVRVLPDVEGKLSDAAVAFGVSSDRYHRAMADVWVTAQLVEAIASRHGLGVLDAAIGKGIGPGGGSYSPRAEREEELLVHYREHGVLPDLQMFGERHRIKKSTVEGDVIRLIEAGEMPRSILENRAVQDWLIPQLEEAITQCWVGEADGRLKPLFEHFTADAPEGFDYTQLRLALSKRG